ncbi:MAG: glycerate kinase, partial [Solirubrobacteraceae bacterium]
MPRVLVAPDSFKGTFDAATVADALAAGLERAGWDADRCPVADGGEGTMAILVGALGGELVPATASDPLGRPVDCRFGLVGDSAVVETAQASGLALVAPDERDPERASTRGTGEMILAAVAAGAQEIHVAAGGSATTDGGAGAIEAIRAGGGLGAARLVVLCDVETAFEDAPRIFGPQKGADPATVARLEQRLARFAAELPKDPRGVPATGAAGGLSGGLWAAFGAELRPGAPAVLDALGVD